MLRAVIDSKAKDYYYRRDAERFLYPKNDEVREHLRLTAECANLDPQWLAECLKRFAGLPMPRLKECINCRSLIPIPDYRPGLSRHTRTPLQPCRAEVPIREKARKRTCAVTARELSARSNS